MATVLTKYRRIRDAATDVLGDKTVVYDPNTGKFFSLNRSAARLWEFLAEWRSIDDIKTFLQREYALEEQLAEQDAARFIAEMHQKSLVEQWEARVV